MSLIPKHISFDNIQLPQLKCHVMKVREWLKMKREASRFKSIHPSIEKINESDVSEYIEKVKNKIGVHPKEIKPEYGIQFEIIDGKVTSKTVKLHEKR